MTEDLNRRREAAEAHVEALTAEVQAVRNLVARLNGDGGHRQDEVGVAQAATEAENRVIEMMNDLSRLRAAARTLVIALRQLHELHNRCQRGEKTGIGEWLGSDAVVGEALHALAGLLPGA